MNEVEVFEKIKAGELSLEDFLEFVESEYDRGFSSGWESGYSDAESFSIGQ